MPRKKFIPVSNFPYHVTNRCNNKEWFDLPMPLVWQIFCEQISNSADRFSVWLHSFVLMSNHFHFIARTPLGNLDNFLRHFLTETCRRLQRASSRINHVFGGRSSQSILGDSYSIAYVYKYVYRNPVRANLCARAEDYPYSTLSRLLRNDCTIPIVEGIDDFWSRVPKSNSDRLKWLNLPTPKELELLITNGLRHSRFRFTQSNTMRKEILLLGRSYGIHEDDPYLLSPFGE